MVIKYHKFQDIPEKLKQEAYQKTLQSPYRQTYHIEPKTGYLNDPNGFAYFNGQYHLYYQWSPIKYVESDVWYQGWYHLVSDDMVHWQSLGPGIEPDTEFETHGVYSGSGMAEGDILRFFYTGNTRNQDNIRIPYQMIAHLTSDGTLIKREKAAISGNLAGYTDHFRDPKIWKKHQDYFAIAGIQRDNQTGAAVILKSEDGEHWQFIGEVETELENFGYMWECPDYFELDHQGVLIFSPQGISPENHCFENIYQTGYLIGSQISNSNLKLNPIASFQELDKGFDIYATQTTVAPDGRRILIGWMGLPEVTYPTEQFGYCGILTLPRVLSIENGQLKQRPIKELSTLRKNKKNLKIDFQESFFEVPNAYELQLEIPYATAGQVLIRFKTSQNKELYTELKIDFEKGEICLNREKSGISFAKDYGFERLLVNSISSEIKIHAFVDTSSLELFINDGEIVASSRIFLSEKQDFLQILGDYQINEVLPATVWKLG